ncbi:SMP-30/gluconolactonase/LRE family protein [Jiangella anatolica]|uniref:Gluconolactonase n=1 Tax=Jiangella anatolica TaxID=2670374 RepID=A0A2W2C0N2_9ACTN|nr:SMP-30/gluconolactonase/LRE family protein [Jiangella anatolica]PZF79326.1 gluconolactonase [Jiangella anatolica]
MTIASLRVPATVPLQVLGRVPDAMAVPGKVSPWAQVERGVDAPLCFLEGPVLDGAGGLYMVDVAWGRILHMAAQGDFSVVLEYDGEPNGLAWLDHDTLAVADFRRGLVLVDGVRSGTPRMRVLLDGADGRPFRGLNDLVVGSDGSIYVTDQGDTGLHDPSGRLYRVRPGGRLETVLDAVPSPNGLALDEEHGVIYLAVTRDNSIWRVPLGHRGPRKVGRFIQLSGGIGPDGIAQGPDGTLLVAHLGMGVVWVYDERGLPLVAFEARHGRATTNVCVDDGGRVYVTESDTSTILTADLTAALAAAGKDLR